MNEEQAICKLCGHPMPPGEEMFHYHGYSGPCPRRHQGGEVVSLSNLLQEAGEWAIPTFPKATPDSWCAHIQREAAELRCAPNDIIEMADILILIGGLAVKQGYTITDLENAVRAKLEINKCRTWGEPDSEGVVEHKEDTQ